MQEAGDDFRHEGVLSFAARRPRGGGLRPDFHERTTGQYIPADSE